MTYNGRVSEAPPSERRQSVRYVACFVMFVEQPDETKLAAMITDLSEVGVRLLVRHPPWAIGEELRLGLHVTLKRELDEPRIVTGHVKRIEALPETRVGLWTHQVAVEFTERIALTDAEREAMATRAAR